MSASEINRIFSKNLNYFLELNDMTQLELAEAIGVSPGTMSHYVNGIKMPRMDKIQAIAIFFGVNISDLLQEKTEKRESGYYLDIETRAAAEELKQDEELRITFDALRNASPEDLKAVQAMLKALKRKEKGEDND